MTTLTRSLAGVLLALTLVPSLAGGGPKPSPKTTVQEQAFSFQVPSDWFPAVFDQGIRNFVPEKNFKPGSLKPGSSLTYASPKGNYFRVEIDPLGRDLEWDIGWTVESRDDRFVLLKESPFCARRPDDFRESCRSGDQWLTILVSPGQLELRGHHYFIEFGNARQEKGVDHQVFRDILASFRAK
jgi:hypothetical protein